MDDERLAEAYRNLNETLASFFKHAESNAAAYDDIFRSLQPSPAIQQMIADLQQAWEESGLTWDEFLTELSKPPTYTFPDYAGMFVKQFNTEYGSGEPMSEPQDEGARVGFRQTYH